MIARKIIIIAPNDTSMGVVQASTVKLPGEGFWRLVLVSAYFNAAAAAAAPSVDFRVVDSRNVMYAGGQMPCGVAGFDSDIAWQKDGQAHVPTVDTQVALQACPSQVLDCNSGLSLVITGNAGSDVAQLTRIRITLEQMATDDGAKL